MHHSKNHSRSERRLIIFSLLILSASLLANQSALTAQSRVKPGSPTVVYETRRDSGTSVDRRLKDRAALTSEAPACVQRMAEETAAYVERAGIPIKAAKGQYFADKDAATFLLSSQEKLNVSDPKAGGKKIVSVINYKAENAASVFYVIEAETRENSIVYSIKRDGRVLKSSAARLQRPSALIGPGVDPCTKINQDNAQFIASLQSTANQTCQTMGACIGVCSNFGNTIAWTLISVKPTYWKCLLEISQYQPIYDFGWLVAVEEPPHGPLIDWTIATAVRNDAALFY
jgi:hypothetical protein